MIRNFFLNLIALLVVMPVHALANQGESETTSTKPSLSFDVLHERSAYAKVSESGAELAYQDTALELSWWFLLLDLDYRVSDWRAGESFSGVAGAEPWGDLVRLTPGVQYYQEFAAQWAIWFKYLAAAGFESELRSGAWTHNPQLIGIQSASKTLKYYAGVGAFIHPVETVVYPVLGIAWMPGELSPWSAAAGFPETRLSYQMTEQSSVKLNLEWDIRTYQLGDDNAMAERGFLRTLDIKPGVYLEYSPREPLTAYFGLRGLWAREMMIYDANKSLLMEPKVRANWAMVTGVEISI